ncbi:DUF305 domain-containing protein [Dactylosporangium siamense]|uniref:DUF305 domain-containing protein n=1 Tax=Dactylosporangium siamense TaxID=685454 RepID=A0A919U4F2_9ACTN|nr:DUF305 domain-containing protein [Dactylosporangium siamense]GIG42054.1 DUF305 domain-containing protein [Dactylosporangium siamense]
MLPRPRRPARRLVTTAVAVALTVATVTACASDPAATSAPATGVVSTDFGGTDIAWVQLMIPMDQQLLPVLDLVSQRSADPALTRLAGELRTRYTTEIQELKALRAKAGLDDSNPHAGHRMPGLVDADTLAAIGATGGAAEFDRKVTACLREHLDQLANLARSELANGTSASVKVLARQVAESRSAGLATLPAAAPTTSAAAGG